MPNQSILILGSLLFLSVLAAGFHRTHLVQTGMTYYNGSAVGAMGVARSVVEDMHHLAFDEKTRTSGIVKVDSLTNPASLGPESGESSRLLYDDVDDFNGHTQTVATGTYGSFHLKVSVYYVERLGTGTKISSRSYAKRADVKVVNTYMPDTLTVSRVFAY